MLLGEGQDLHRPREDADGLGRVPKGLTVAPHGLDRIRLDRHLATLPVGDTPLVVDLEAAEGSPVVGKTLKEARIPEETGMWVLVIRRGERWIRPRPSAVIQAGDVIIASGYAEGEEDFKKLLGGGPDSQS